MWWECGAFVPCLPQRYYPTLVFGGRSLTTTPEKADERKDHKECHDCQEGKEIYIPHTFYRCSAIDGGNHPKNSYEKIEEEEEL